MNGTSKIGLLLPHFLHKKCRGPFDSLHYKWLNYKFFRGFESSTFAAKARIIEVHPLVFNHLKSRFLNTTY